MGRRHLRVRDEVSLRHAEFLGERAKMLRTRQPLTRFPLPDRLAAHREPFSEFFLTPPLRDAQRAEAISEASLG